jgi:hypothetical protein
MLALHLLLSSLVFINTQLLQAVLRDPAWTWTPALTSPPPDASHPPAAAPPHGAAAGGYRPG